MFIELVDVLRCPNVHQPSQLVASPYEMSGRYIRQGLLGCPVCKSEYEVRDGVAYFAGDQLRPPADTSQQSDYEALRCSALLDLHGTQGFAILGGEWGTLAPAMTDAVKVQLVLLDPPENVAPADGLSIIVAGPVPPLAPGSARGIALDQALISLCGMDVLLALVASGGRVVAPVDVGLPSQAHMLASDERHWVAEVTHPTVATLQLRRGRTR